MAVIDDRTTRSYALPNAANKIKDDVVRLREALAAIDGDVVEILAALLTKAAAVHGHSIDQISGLVSALAGKAAADHAHALADLTDTDVAGAANGQLLKRVGTKWSPAALALGDIDGWEDTVAAMIAASVASLVNSAPGMLDTLGEMAAAFGNDPNFATTMATALGNRLRVDAAQGLTAAAKDHGRANLGLGSLAQQNAITGSGQLSAGVVVFGALAASAIASLAEAQGAVASNVLMTPARTGDTVRALSPASIGPAGYQRLPSGLILQWGYYNGGVEDVTIAFPVSYPGAAILVVATVCDPPDTAATQSWSIAVSNINPSNFLARRRRNGSVSGYSINSNYPVNFSWISVGY